MNYRRVSFREMRIRLACVDEFRLHPEGLSSRSAYVVIESIGARLTFNPGDRHAVLHESGTDGVLRTVPQPTSDGLFKRGTKPAGGNFPVRTNSDHHPELELIDTHNLRQKLRCSAFANEHPVGSIVTGRVVKRAKRSAQLDLGLGLRGRLDDCLDHDTGKVVWREVPQKGAIVDAYVRKVNPDACLIWLSLHDFSRDTRFNLYSSGYRSSYDSSGSPFEKLPWEKEWQSKYPRKRL